MQQLLQLFILVPLAGFFLSLFLPRKKESIISAIAISTIVLHIIGLLIFIAYWLMNNSPTLDVKHHVLFKARDFEIFIDFYFDKITAVYALTGAVLTFLVTIFSRYYMHREEGFKRFFNTLLLFYLGYNIIIFAGNFETLFTGWELLGISSFLLIAFYRDRYLPVKNGLKVISLYRLSDICLLVALWLSHHLWHENITFMKLNDSVLVAGQIGNYFNRSLAFSLMILIAAAIKSAQLPFSSWLPRAMEGPTTSSAIFYGSLSVHIGVFLLLRTYPFWESILIIKVGIVLIGAITSIVASYIASVQSTVKTQIAYSSVVQIGIIFIEVALGLHTLALIHFAGNAFLRTYQLLVSPSVLSYLTHDQFYHFNPDDQKRKITRFEKLKNTVYILSLKEWNLDSFLTQFFWQPFKWLGHKLYFINSTPSVISLIFLFLFAFYNFLNPDFISGSLYSVLPVLCSLAGLFLILRSFIERGSAIHSWLLAFFSQFFILLSILLNQRLGIKEVIIYLSGTMISGIVGYICLKRVKEIDNDIELNGFHGYTYEKPGLAFVFLLSCLGLFGFPITPSFLGIDILFSNINQNQFALLVFSCLSFVFIEISLLRIYARIFMGQHKKAYHPIAFRSS